MEIYLPKHFKYAALYFGIVLVAVLFSGCQIINADKEKIVLPDDAHYQVITETGAVVADMLVSGSDYYPGEPVTVSLIIANEGNKREDFWVGCSIKDPLGKWYDLPAKEVNLEGGELTSVEFTWVIPEIETEKQLLSGPYLLTMAAWSDHPGEENAEKLATVKQEEAFFVFRYIEEFSSYNEELWEKSSHPLGLGNLDPDNIEIEDDLLKITLPAGTYDGGQLESREFDHLYGSYRASIKIADAPSSITGFFLYRAPDFYHEIDIEVVNDSSGRAWFTTYAGGEISNTSERYFGFDPTADFYEYRFDFYPGSVSFYVDGELIISFDDGLTDTPMKLMVNSWFPVWLEGIKSEQDAVTLVDWIKY